MLEPRNLGLCNTCRARVPSEFFQRDGQAWIRKDCTTCGPTESLVSMDYQVWQGKRDRYPYVPLDRQACTLQCDRCGINHTPSIVFLDVTNRCNMNCPICIATIRDMGFDFNPPLDYFEKIFAHISKFNPKPMVELFGGEPTVRDDLPQIIAIGRKYELRPRVVTNGVRLADEEYCRSLCESGTRLRFAFDGRSADVYEKLRRNRAAYDKKMAALANLKKYSRRRHALICCFGRGVNDHLMADMLQFCHDNRDLISDIGVIPLTENWHEGDFSVEVHTTLEDVEKMVQESVPGGGVDFVPAGLSYALRQPRSFFRRTTRSEVLLLSGVHPNCESFAFLISDGKQYRSASHYLRVPFAQVADEVLQRCRKLEPKLNRLDRNRFFQRQRGRWLVLKTFVPWGLRRVRLGRLMGNPLTAIGRLLAGAVRRALSDKTFRHRRAKRLLRVAVLPFEEFHSIDAARMENCKAVFAYEDPQGGAIKTIPACTWYHYRNPILEQLAGKYGTAGKPKTQETPTTV